jgi:hypothetical protein
LKSSYLLYFRIPSTFIFFFFFFIKLSPFLQFIYSIITVFLIIECKGLSYIFKAVNIYSKFKPYGSVWVVFEHDRVFNNNQQQNILTFFTFYITFIIFYYYLNKKNLLQYKFFFFIRTFFTLYHIHTFY